MNEFEFSLPKGFVDADRTVHTQGIMRLATAKDELTVRGDRRVRENPAYWLILMLSRVVTKIGDIETITPELIEDLYTPDLGYLQRFYNQINTEGLPQLGVVCPNCNHTFPVELTPVGES